MSLTLADVLKAFECISQHSIDEFHIHSLLRQRQSPPDDNNVTSFLPEIQQVVSIMRAYSSSLPAPQGSIVGPILFRNIVKDINKLGNMVLSCGRHNTVRQRKFTFVHFGGQ